MFGGRGGGGCKHTFLVHRNVLMGTVANVLDRDDVIPILKKCHLIQSKLHFPPVWVPATIWEVIRVPLQPHSACVHLQVQLQSPNNLIAVEISDSAEAQYEFESSFHGVSHSLFLGEHFALRGLSLQV